MPIRATCEAAHPILHTLYGQHDDLRSRVQNFWADGLNCFAEAEVLAHHAEALEATDFSILRPRLEAALATVPLDLALESETPEDRSKNSELPGATSAVR